MKQTIYMRDLFYTILIVWLVSKIYNSFQSKFSANSTQNDPEAQRKKQGEIHIEDLSKKSHEKKNRDDGEYVDYEEIK